VQHILSQPRGFAPLIELDLFMDVHSVQPGPEPGLDAPRQRICRMCAAEVLLYGLKDWWIRERKKGHLDANIAERPDCPDGTTCRRQKEHGKTLSHLLRLGKRLILFDVLLVHARECTSPCLFSIQVFSVFSLNTL
jgi:E3 ubiquitin-protein ligase CHFR